MEKPGDKEKVAGDFFKEGKTTTATTKDYRKKKHRGREWRKKGRRGEKTMITRVEQPNRRMMRGDKLK